MQPRFVVERVVGNFVPRFRQHRDRVVILSQCGVLSNDEASHSQLARVQEIYDSRDDQI
jgi:aryl-alcohol dehydrogenase-like predicted oxidoreductase